jgi:quercetin 2,3-dioxygenase
MRLLFAIVFGITAIAVYQVNLASITASLRAFIPRNISRLSAAFRPISLHTTASSHPSMAATSEKHTSSAFPGLPAVPPHDPSLTKPESQSVPRKIKEAFLAIEQAEGAGARVRRSIGTPKLRRFSPFLMLDHFSISPGAGFPDHPHRYVEIRSLTR